MKKRIFLILTLVIISCAFLSAQTRLELSITNLPEQVAVGEIFTLKLSINTEAKYEIREVIAIQPPGTPHFLEVLSIEGLEVVVKAIKKGVQAINFTVNAAYYFPDDPVQGRVIGLTTNTTPITIVAGGPGVLALSIPNLPKQVEVGEIFTLYLNINTDAKYEIQEVTFIQPPGAEPLFELVSIDELDVVIKAIKDGIQAINFTVTAAYYLPDDVVQGRIIGLTTNTAPVTVIPFVQEPLALTIENLPEKVVVGDFFTLNLKINTRAKYEIQELIVIQPPGAEPLMEVVSTNGLHVRVKAVKEGIQAINFTVNAAYYFPDDPVQGRVIGLTTNVKPITILPRTRLCGDVNDNRVVDVIDGLLIAQYYVGLIQTLQVPQAADVNNDSIINIIDALLVIQYYIGFDVKLNCGAE
ncbi:MAG: dockerin type I repeat-containing protein [Spirochaetales bacterium]|nr:dockerin type I repeat-containing protein [Spirochaetales bacterium]